MEEILLKAVSSNSAFAGLFCFMLFYVLKENAKREQELRSLLKELADIAQAKLDRILDKI